MNKRTYIKPEVNVIKILTENFICMSNNMDLNYEETNIVGSWQNDSFFENL